MAIRPGWPPLAALALALLAGPALGAMAQGPAPAGPKPRRPLIDVANPPPTTWSRRPKPPRDPNIPRPSMDNPPESVEVRFSGVIRDLAGGPIAGATVQVLGTRTRYAPKFAIETKLAGATTTDADGRYRLASPIPTSPGRGGQESTPYAQFQVIARAPGFGLGWHQTGAMYALPWPDPDDERELSPLNSPAEIDIHLRPEGELKGRVIDEAGRPVPGVSVGNGGIHLLDEKGEETTVEFAIDPGIVPGVFDRAVTDADGRFRMPGLPAETCCWLHFERPGTSMSHSLYASTTAEAEANHKRAGSIPLSDPDKGFHLVHPADLVLTMPTPRRLAVRVVAEDDGRPVPNARLDLVKAKYFDGLYSGGQADAEGRVALDLPAGTYPALCADPAEPDSRFFRTYLRPLVIAPEPAEQPLRIRMRVAREVLIEVVDAATGLGIPGAYFEMKTGGDNERWARLRGTETRFLTDGEPSDADGKFRALLDPNKKGPRRVRVVGVGLDVPINPMKVGLPWAGYDPHTLPYEAVEGLSEPFEPTPGRPVNLRFVLRKK